MNEVEIIEALKKNERAYCFWTEEEQIFACRQRTEDFALVVGNIELRERIENSFNHLLTYRLRPDYQPPKREEGGWVEFDVKVRTYAKTANQYFFAEENIPLHRATGLEGFGGVKYEAPCDCDCCDTYDGFIMRTPKPCEKHGPTKPVAVRFWRRKNG